MIYILLNLAATIFLLYFTVYVDKKLNIESTEPSTFSISVLMATIEAGLFTLILLLSKAQITALTTQLMRIVMILDGLIFVNLSFGIVSLGGNTKKSIVKITKYLLIIVCFILVFTKFKTITVDFQQGVIIASEFLFTGDARVYFPWTWVTIFTAFYKFILPTLSIISLMLLQENKSTQLQKYQTFILIEAFIMMWMIHFFTKFVSTVIPEFSLIFLYSYIALFVVVIISLAKTTVPSGKGIFVFILKIVISYLLPAFIIGGIFSFLQPASAIYKSPQLGGYIFASVVGVLYALWVSEILSSNTKFNTADYEGSLEHDLASVNYQNAEMDEITYKMNEIIKRNVEASSMNVYILGKQNELETAYSSNNLNVSIPVNNPIFDTLLNNNKNVVIYQEIEKEHSVSAISKELSEFFDLTKSDALFILNEGHNIFGIITLGKKASGDHFKDYDYNVFTKLYSYFFVFGYYMRNISNKDIIGVVNREIKMSSQIITSIQENIDHITNPKVDIGYMMVPSHNIGGEFIDLIRLTDTRHLFVVGDLSGKGIAASMNMVILKSIIRTYLTETHDFKELVVKVNTFIRDSLRKGTIFAGLFALVDFETDTMYYINCGIPALMMYTQVYNNVIEIQGSGHILGFVKDLSPWISVKTTKLNRGDIILACTDGLINSHSLRGEQFGKERVQQALLDNSTYPAQRMAQFTFDGLLKFMSKEMEDDVSILVMKYESSAEYADKAIEEEKNAEENETQVTEDSSETVTETPSEESVPTETVEENQVSDVAPAEESVETPAAEETTSPQDDMPLPDGFEMPDLSNLDDLLKNAGL